VSLREPNFPIPELAISCHLPPFLILGISIACWQHRMIARRIGTHKFWPLRLQFPTWKRKIVVQGFTHFPCVSPSPNRSKNPTIGVFVAARSQVSRRAFCSFNILTPNFPTVDIVIYFLSAGYAMPSFPCSFLESTPLEKKIALGRSRTGRKCPIATRLVHDLGHTRTVLTLPASTQNPSCVCWFQILSSC